MARIIFGVNQAASFAALPARSILDLRPDQGSVTDAPFDVIRKVGHLASPLSKMLAGTEQVGSTIAAARTIADVHRRQLQLGWLRLDEIAHRQPLARLIVRPPSNDRNLTRYRPWLRRHPFGGSPDPDDGIMERINKEFYHAVVWLRRFGACRWSYRLNVRVSSAGRF